MLVAGAAVFLSTSSALKSVCVSSSLLGPRSRDLGGRDCMSTGVVVWMLRLLVGLLAGRRLAHDEEVDLVAGQSLAREDAIDEARRGRVED